MSDKLDEAQEILLKKLEEGDWDMSHERLEELANDMTMWFPNRDEALEFVESHASSLFDMMQDVAQRRSAGASRRPSMPRDSEGEGE
jgi:hypothetical protein